MTPTSDVQIFVADLHLDGTATPRALAFRGLLADLSQKAANGSVTLFVIGDLFEFWEEAHSQVAAIYEDDLKALEAANRSGVKIVLFSGNRDFLYGSYVKQRLAAQYVPDGLKVDSLWLEHGDLLCTGDVRYLRYRKWVRSWPVRALLYCMPWFCAKRLIGKLRSQTVKDKASKPREAFDVDVVAARARLMAEHAKTLLCGHTHRAQETDLGEGRRLFVLPPWCDEPAGYVSDGTGLKRMRFGSDGRTWQPWAL